MSIFYFLESQNILYYYDYYIADNKILRLKTNSSSLKILRYVKVRKEFEQNIYVK